ncbi:MAG: nuclear transport factor 2 family protein [Bacteroidota bacterium]
MKNLPLISLVLLFFLACQSTETTQPLTADVEQNKAAFVQTLETHLNAVSQRDLATLEATLSPQGDMHLILPQSKMTSTVDAFMDYHRSWFKLESDWTLENKIVYTNVGQDMGLAVVEAVYREPERDGKPYFNRMNVSYDLKKVDGKWYVVKDHMCSVAKSTDTDAR